MKKEFIDNLLLSINDLRERVNSIKDGDDVSFSFFKDAYNKTEMIMRNLHEMEILQIEEMKEEMRKLIVFLGEKEKKVDESVHEDDVEIQRTHKFERNIILPEYRKSDKTDRTDRTDRSERPERTDKIDRIERTEISDKIDRIERPDSIDRADRSDRVYESDKTVKSEVDNPTVMSLNDKIHKDPAVLDLKRGLSLNDRFLFQRELFNNDRYAMNSIMLKLNAFDNYEDVEKYLQDSMPWNFEDKTVNDFLSMLKKGFE